jgi:hypothetical protein
MLRASPAAAAPVTGRLGDGNGSYSIVGSERHWVQLRLADGTSGWTSIDQFCTDICRALLDVANFANDVVALTSAIASGSAGFANLLAIARVQWELTRVSARKPKFDRIRLDRQAIGRIADQLAEASVADPSDVDIVENLAVLFGYLGDNTRRRLALEIAANLKTKAR